MTYYQTYIEQEMTIKKVDVKAIKTSLAQIKKDIAATKKLHKRSKDEDEKSMLQAKLNTLDDIKSTKDRALFRLQQGVNQLATMKKLRYAKLDNGTIVETSKLDEFKKRFSKYRMTYDYEVSIEGLVVNYQKDGVKGTLTLYPCSYDFPEYVTFPQID